MVLETEGVFHNQTTVTLSSQSDQTDGQSIRYTTDGSQPVSTSSIYERPFPVDKTTVVRAATFENGKQTGHGTRRTLVLVEPNK